jgi:DNA-binding transcriptional LysR family regulator
MLRIRQLNVFHAIVQTGSVTAASSQLGMSQPAASQTLKDLEMALDFKLFERDGRGLRLTEAGEMFFIESEKSLYVMQELEQRAQAIKEGNRGQMSIACEAAWGASLLTPVLSKFMERRPDVSLAVYPFATSYFHSWMSGGMIDIAVTRVPINNQNFIQERLGSSEAVIILPKSHPLCAQSTIHAEQVSEEDFIVLSSRNELNYYRSAAAFQNLGVVRNIRVFSPLSESVFSLVEQGAGVSIVSKMICETLSDQFDVEWRPFEPKIRYDVFGYKRRGMPSNRHETLFFDLLREHIA